MCRLSCASKPRDRPATTRLAASRLRSNSNGPWQRLVEVVDVEEQVAFRRGEQAEVDEVGIAAELDLDARARADREVGGHRQRRAAIERERRDRHPAIADRDELRDPGRRLLLEEGDGIRPVGGRRPRPERGRRDGGPRRLTGRTAFVAGLARSPIGSGWLIARQVVAGASPGAGVAAGAPSRRYAVDGLDDRVVDVAGADLLGQAVRVELGDGRSG